MPEEKKDSGKGESTSETVEQSHAVPADADSLIADPGSTPSKKKSRKPIETETGAKLSSAQED